MTFRGSWRSGGGECLQKASEMKGRRLRLGTVSKEKSKKGFSMVSKCFIVLAIILFIIFLYTVIFFTHSFLHIFYLFVHIY